MKTKAFTQHLILAAVCATGKCYATSPVPDLDNGHYYQFVGVELTWDASSVAAQQQTYLGVQGHLATITSAAEQSFVYNQVLLPNIPAPTKDNSAYLGGYQISGSQEPAGGWAWVTGETWDYSAWAAGEPNDGVGYNMTPQNYLVMWGSGPWDDGNGDFSQLPNHIPPLGYIVEFDVPEPSSFSLALLGCALMARAIRRKR